MSSNFGDDMGNRFTFRRASSTVEPAPTTSEGNALESVGRNMTVTEPAATTSEGNALERGKRNITVTDTGTENTRTTSSERRSSKKSLGPSSDTLTVKLSIGQPQFETWHQQRTIKAAEIDLARPAGTNLVLEDSKLDSLDHAALRLRKIILDTSEGATIPPEVLIQNLQHCVKVLENSYVKLQSRTSAVSSDDVISDTNSAALLPLDIVAWLEHTFNQSKRRITHARRPSSRERKPTWRAAIRTVQAGMAFKKIFQKLPNEIMQDNFSPEALKVLKNVDKWTFDIFELELKCPENTLQCMFLKLFTKYNLVKKFKIPVNVLLNYALKLQQGYRKYDLVYHNMSHAADVAQTVNVLINESGFLAWLSDLDIFAMLLAALIHDVEHPGTTNDFQIETRSPLALLYNDKSVLEQHHVSTAFRYMQDEKYDIMRNFTKEEYGDCRAMIIEMVLSTDMSLHLDLLKRVDSGMDPLVLEKVTAMCLVVHSADVSNPVKPWKLHHKWTQKILAEFFYQGDRERSLGIPISPLFDRNTCEISKSQIGFIDFIVVPTFTSLFRVFRETLFWVFEEVIATSSKTESFFQKSILKATFGDLQSETRSRFPYDYEITKLKLLELSEKCFSLITRNREEWLYWDKIEEDLNLFGTDALNYQFALSHNTAIPEETVADVTGKNLHGVSRSSKDFKEDKLRIPDRKPKVASLSSIAESRPEKSC